MKKYPKSLKIQSFGCIILQATAADDECNVREIHEKGGVACLIHAIDKFPDQLACRQSGLRALRLLVMIAPIADKIPVIIKAMQGHVDDIESQVYVCGILSHLTSPQEQPSESMSRNCTLLVHNGGIPALVASLENSLELTKAQRQSCVDAEEIMEGKLIPIDVLSCFKNVILSVDDATTLGSTFAEANAPESILKAMRWWQDCDRIQSLACFVLAKTEMLREAQGVEPILAAMNLIKTTTLSDEGLVWKLSFAVRALCIINRNLEGAIAFQNASGIASVVDMLQEPFPHAPLDLMAKLHETLAEAMMLCMGTFLNDNVDASKLFAEMSGSGVIPTLLWSMQQFPDNARIQRDGCAILQILGMNTRGIIRVANDGGKRVLETAKRLHVNEGAVQEAASELLEWIKGIDNITHCHTCLASGENLMQCSRCKKVVYCNRKCQREDYKLHKKLCMQMSTVSGANGDIK